MQCWIVNRDANGIIGQNITTYLTSSPYIDTIPHLTWNVVDPSLYPTDADLDYQVAVEETTWAVILIGQDATAALQTAQSTGDATYNPQSAVTLIYSESRSQQAVGGLIVSSTQSALAPVLARMSATLTAEYLSTILTDTAALNLVLAAPQTISGSIALGLRNTRPYLASTVYAAAILAATYVGLIYLCIVAFSTVMANFGARQAISRRLKLSSLIGMRILVPITLYFFLSLMFSLLQIAFKLPFDGWGRSYGAGFMTFWMLAWSGMMSLGLCLEACLSLVGPQFIFLPLIYIIVTNVSGALLPLELSPDFFKYSLAMPFYNLKQGFLIIFTNAGKHSSIAKYEGILLGWIVVMILTFPIWIWFERRKEEKQAAQKKGA